MKWESDKKKEEEKKVEDAAKDEIKKTMGTENEEIRVHIYNVIKQASYSGSIPTFSVIVKEYIITILKEMFNNKIKDYESYAPAKYSTPVFAQFKLKDRSELTISEQHTSMANIVEGLYICIDNEEEWPDMTVDILDKFVHKPDLYLKLLKFKHERLLKEENIFDTVFKFTGQQSKDSGVQYHSILKHFYKDVSEMPENVFKKWFKILNNKKWLISEISDKDSSLNFKRKTPLSEEERSKLKAQRQQ
jgi:hypothetical protein